MRSWLDRPAAVLARRRTRIELGAAATQNLEAAPAGGVAPEFMMLILGTVE